MYLKFNLYTDEEFEKETILIKNKNELTDNTTSFILNPQLPCKQCKSMIDCPGHTGRIPLYYRIVHPVFVNILCKEISHICPVCKKYDPLLSTNNPCCEKRVVATTFSYHKVKSEEVTSNKSKYSKNFEKESKNISEYSFTFGRETLSIEQMYEEIRSANFSKNPELQNHLLNVFIKNIPVLPINMRPSILDSSNTTIHNNVTTLYQRSVYIVRAYNLYKKILGIRSKNDSVEDANRNYIKQMLSGKNGIFRSMCLAKRQNFCLRSVIVPNIDIPLDVVLIPKVFTDSLIPYGYKTNDFVIINRQPTLQTTSILAVHSRPSNCRTIQINPLIANVFQADFDGDEMNIFWLPGEEAKEELATKLNIANNIRSFKNASIMIKFIQDTLTGIYNMTRNKEIIDIDIVKRMCDKLGIPDSDWKKFCKYYKSRMNSTDIPYAHLLSLLLPRTLTLHDHEGNLIVDKGILLGVISDKNQTILLNAISNYGNEFYLKFIILNKMDPIPVLNLDSLIENQNKFENYNEFKNQVFRKYCDLTELVESIDNNLTNIINSGSKGNVDNVIQILMSVGVQAILPVCYIKSSYSEGLTAKELFIHSKSGRAGIISTSLNTSSTGYLQRELVKSMEDLVTDETRNIDETFLEHAFSMASL
ncbi:beta and beta-prime subunits of DNA dependent RNA-polymerase [Neocallimastix lanati (nom. inval.)]|nr:beta and beta-prime subunits of DNA dependent RNA-polymerase [Neocallimastix sp. JGI-2020a]